MPKAIDGLSFDKIPFINELIFETFYTDYVNGIPKTDEKKEFLYAGYYNADRDSRSGKFKYYKKFTNKNKNDYEKIQKEILTEHEKKMNEPITCKTGGSSLEKESLKKHAFSGEFQSETEGAGRMKNQYFMTIEYYAIHNLLIGIFTLYLNGNDLFFVIAVVSIL